MGQQAPKSENAIKIGVLGTANITSTAIVKPASQLQDAVVYGVAARDITRARAYAKEHSIPHVRDTYSELLSDPEIDAIYIPLPNAFHFEWCKKAIESGKHVLCEKPLTNNAEEAEELQTLLLNCAFPLVFAEAFHYRYHPATVRVKQIVEEELGHLESVNVVMDVPSLFLSGNINTNIRFKSELGGGATMDLGCYCISVIQYFGGNIESVTKAVSQIHEKDKDIDIAMRATLLLERGTEASFYCGFMSTIIPTIEVTIKGEKGSVIYNNFIRPDMLHSITVSLKNGAKRTETVYGDRGWSTYHYQLSEFCAAVRKAKSGEEISVLTGIDEGVKIMRIIDRVYESAGLTPRMKYVKHT